MDENEEKAKDLRKQIRKLREELSRLPIPPSQNRKAKYIIGKSYELLFFRVYDRYSNILTIRELETVTLLFLGHKNAKIAGEMFIQEKSVKFHLTKIYAKMDVRNRLECILKISAVLNVPTALTPKPHILSDD